MTTRTTDVVAAFFGDLAGRGHEPSLKKLSGTVRFDLVAETYTLQVRPPPERATAARILGELVAPAGTLLVIARGRESDDAEGAMPWPLTRAEVEAIGCQAMPLTSFEDFVDAEDPPVRRFRATFRRP